jgi:hypothetical protein
MGGILGHRFGKLLNLWQWLVHIIKAQLEKCFRKVRILELIFQWNKYTKNEMN